MSPPELAAPRQRVAEARCSTTDALRVRALRCYIVLAMSSLGSLTPLLTVDAQYVVTVAPSTRAPAPLHAIGVDALPTTPAFRNLSHGDISPFWAHKKADGNERNAVNLVTGLLGVDWVPLLDKPIEEATTADRAPKRTACGEVDASTLFVGREPTGEFDWTFHISPQNSRLVDTTILHRNSTRVRSFSWFENGLIHLYSIYDSTVAGTAKTYDPSNWALGSGGFIVETEVTAPRSLLTSQLARSPARRGHVALAVRWESGKSTKTR